MNEPKIRQADFMPGETVRIRSRKEIMATLDTHGALDGLPFMPEMLQFCGRTFTVFRRADKTCDTIDNHGAMRMHNTVHLTGLRCDGVSHGGCEAECLLFWKESWLQRNNTETNESADIEAMQQKLAGLTAVQRGTSDDEKNIRYRCQATELKKAAVPLQWWDVRQYVRDVRIGNATIAQLIRAAIFSAYRTLVEFGVGYRMLIKAYDGLQRVTGGTKYPFRDGMCSGRTPTGELHLKVGEFVRVRSHAEILQSLDKNSKNRGLWFDAEMVPYCGKIYRVSKRVTRIINEKSGEMIQLRNPCIVLENVYCKGKYTKLRLFCPRSIPSYWREIWLERVGEDEVRTSI